MTRPTAAARRVHWAAAACIIVAAAFSSYAGWGRPAAYGIVALALAITCSEVATVYLSLGRQQWALSLTEAAVGAGLVFATGAWTVVAVALGVCGAQVYRHRPVLKLEYNVAQFAASAAAAAAGSRAIGGGVTGALVGMAAFWLVNNLAVTGVIALTSAQRFRDIVISAGPLNALHSMGNTSIGLLAAWLTLHAPLGLLALVVPLGLLWVSYDQQTQQAFQARMFAELAAGQERVAGRSLDISARVVLTAATRLFGGDAEIILLDTDPPARFVGDEAGVTRSRAAGGCFDEPWVLRALGRRGLLTGVDACRPFCSGVLGDPDRPIAVLIIRRADGGPPFSRREAMLASVMFQQAQSWLSVAELSASRDEAVRYAEAAGEAARALGDLGAHTWPALASLRESANRLARLATRPEGTDPVHEIVEELHATERAVAALLGAIAADPGLATAAHLADVPAQARPVEDEWTTTGVLAGDQVEPSR